VTTPLGQLAPAGGDLSEAATGPPRLTAVNGGVMHQVQMENAHPLRVRILLEIDRTGSISTAADRCGIGQPSGVDAPPDAGDGDRTAAGDSAAGAG
jgi:hypothetical protein